MRRFAPLAPILLTAAMLLAGDARQATEFSVSADSRFWIEGSATTGPFSCEAAEVRGQARLLHAPGGLAGLVVIPVESLDCGIGRMNRDLRRAMLADQHPAIRFELQRGSVAGQVGQADRWVEVRAVGSLTLAGAEQLVAVRGEGRRLPNGHVQVRGSHGLLMSDYGIDPPSGLLGLVRADDRIIARFDITAAVN